jgi:16S rRNA (guanine527-N7)-methyltransferase
MAKTENRKLKTENVPDDPLDLLQEGAAALGLEFSPATVEQSGFYLTELQRWNARVNLTALREPRDIVVQHFLDSLAILRYLEGAASLADLGSGAGFPGLALKLARPELTLTLVEARQKKAAFLEYLVACLKLPGVEVAQIHLTPRGARRWGPRFAAVTSRAAFSLEYFLELAAPLLLPGGCALALKGPHLPETDLQKARGGLARLGLTPLELLEYYLPLSGEPRLLVRARRGP